MKICMPGPSGRIPGLLRRLSMSLALCCGAASAQPLVMGILPLHYRTAEQVIPLVRPLVPPPGTVSGIQNQLIVHTTPANLAEIRAVLERIDAMPRRLLISVRHDSDMAASADRIAVEGTVALGRGEVSAGSRLPGGGARVEAHATSRHQSDRTMQQVQALEGQPAMIQTGRSVPVPVRQVVRGPAGAQVVDSVEYREAATGFQVIARLAGDQVILDILPQRQVPAGDGWPGAVNTQQLATTVRARLGEWIDLGGTVRTIDERQTVLLGRAGAGGSEQRRVMVRVEALP